MENQTLNIEGVRNISGFNEASYTAGGIITSSASAVNIGNDTTLDFKYGNSIRNTYNSQLTIGENVSFTSYEHQMGTLMALFTTMQHQLPQ